MSDTDTAADEGTRWLRVEIPVPQTTPVDIDAAAALAAEAVRAYLTAHPLER